MEVTVIIPVYNAEAFVAAAIDSALAQPEVAEVLLVEDGSPDGALSICQQYAEADERVTLLRHPDGENRGPGASRNLGMRHARSSFIAFLDADDIYLPGRFSESQKTFERFPEADGVYETVGVTYHDKSLKRKHIDRVGAEHTGIAKFIHPKQLFRTLATGKFGHIHLNGLVLRKSAITGDLLFDISLKQCQDSDLMFRMSTRLNLYRGGSRAVARRGVHEQNRVFDHEETREYKRKYLRKCIDHKFYGSKDFSANMYVILRYISTLPVYRPFSNFGIISNGVRGLLALAFLCRHPSLLLYQMRVLLSRSPRIDPVAGQQEMAAQ